MDFKKHLTPDDLIVEIELILDVSYGRFGRFIPYALDDTFLSKGQAWFSFCSYFS